ncbi:MAG TPA: leucyl/phenylalanyl-tRNA--protein transferase [Myxococcota bacterium]|nr:leucyl/phenylalanyl-tRNA--protein transferase [Myxococcota bacterium]
MPLWLDKSRRPLFDPPERVVPGVDGLVYLGGRLDADAMIEACQKGLFCWDGSPPFPWFSPDPRTILRPWRFHAARDVRRLTRRRTLEVTYDRDPMEVVRACATTPRRDGGGTWITPHYERTYAELIERGALHAVEVREEGRLVGGLYGLALGRAFFGESMFHHRPHASKVGLYDLCVRLDAAGYRFIDCQVHTEHLASLGAQGLARRLYLQELDRALAMPDGWADAMAASGATGGLARVGDPSDVDDRP